jgi:4-hydroxy-4-methyl-2-oxoglutarate aldolase
MPRPVCEPDFNMSAALSDIRRDFERVAPATVGAASAYAASILADVAGRRGTMDGRIAALAPAMRACGPAFTIEVRAGDNLMIHAAMALAQPGDVLVIDGKADRTCALMGSIMLNACKKLGLAGVVIDGSIRDTEELRELGFPVWAIGANPNGPTKNVPGRINGPISCGGASVNPGDLIVGDADGVVVIERERAASLLPLAAQKVADERQRIADIASGKAIRPKWLDASLVAAGVLPPGERL